ncbi:uncharacterized protein LOC107981401 isoform X2 [Nasonia vitripennis]|uniref:Uncharacterized protein n=1 Tax=Nasonia vitripennis TaxID=7425 RepID=A0A7M7QE15_NASVI|nr:uncharacterized protein LOC107981401 isoform X2 [Nasonia vitripennis]
MSGADDVPLRDDIPLKEYLSRIKIKDDKQFDLFKRTLRSTYKENISRRDAQNKTKLCNSARKEANPLIKYYHVVYECIHGKERVSTSTGQRNAKTSKFICPATITFTWSQDGFYYFVSEVISHKGHEHFKGLTHTLPQNRKCDEETENFISLARISFN